jgi:hypothetical protein
MLLWYGGRCATRVALDARAGARGRGHPIARRVVVRARAWGHWRGGSVVVVVGHVARGRRGVLRAVHVRRDVDLEWGRGEIEVVVREEKEPRPMPAHRGMRKLRTALRVRS